MKIAFIQEQRTTSIFGTYDVQHLYDNPKRGLTGSESFLFNTARTLAEANHEVTVFADFNYNYGHEGLSLKKLNELDVATKDYDAVLSWCIPDLLKQVKPGVPRILVQQWNDEGCGDRDYKNYTDWIVLPSENHKRHMIETCHLDPSKCVVIPNSNNPEHFARHDIARVKHRMVWCSSPCRGLHHMLEMFPLIKQRIPDAELRIFYRLRPWYEELKNECDSKHPSIRKLAHRAKYVKEALDVLGWNGENGVTVYDSVSNHQMAEELLAASALTYPCDPIAYTEGFGVSILDACVAGAVPIISDVDAIGEVFKDAALIIPGRPGSCHGTWIETICKVLTDDSYRDPLVQKSVKFSEQHTRQVRNKQWEEFLSFNKKPMQVATFTEPEPSQYIPDESVVRFNRQNLRVAIFMDRGIFGPRPPVNPDNVWGDPRGLSGTESTALHEAFGLAKLGYKVTFFSWLTRECNVGGVDFRQQETYAQQGVFDFSISHLFPGLMVNQPKLFRNRTLVHHGGNWDHISRAELDSINWFVGVADHQTAHLKKQKPEIADYRWNVINNAADLALFEKYRNEVKKVPGRCVYISSPDRGLHHLVHAWPEIKKARPDATLKIFYWLDPWINQLVQPYNANLPDKEIIAMHYRAKYIKAVLPTLQGVEVIGQVSKDRITKELCEAEVLSYPCDTVKYSECHPVSILEAAAAGCRLVLSECDSVYSLFKDVATFAPRENFAPAVIEAVNSSASREPVLAYAKNYSIDIMIKKWDEQFRKICTGELQ